HQQRLDLAETAAGVQAIRISGELADRFDIGGEPGEPMRRALLAVERRFVHATVDEHAPTHCGRRLSAEALDRSGRPAHAPGQLAAGLAALRLVPHPVLLNRSGSSPAYACSAQMPTPARRGILTIVTWLGFSATMSRGHPESADATRRQH